MAPTRFAWHETPIGVMLLAVRDGRLTTSSVIDRPDEHRVEADWVEGPDAVLDAARKQLDAYFDGERRTFNLPLDSGGTPFQRRAWEVIAAIPYGGTISYAEQAERAGAPGASRAVGSANGRNPICLIVPCHRVIASGGGLGGYGGGLDRKLWLLQHEADVLGQPVPESWTNDPRVRTTARSSPRR